MRELDQYEAECHACGIHWSILEDPDIYFTPEHKTCPACKGMAQYAQRLRKEDDRRTDKSDPYAPDPSSGRQISLRGLTPAEVETLRKRSVAQQAPGK